MKIRLHSLFVLLVARAALLSVVLCFAIGGSANAVPLSGTKTVGPTGNYASVTAAITDVQAQGLGGALVLELQAAYISSVETFPLVFTNLGATSSNTLTLRPQSGAVNRIISSADTTAATMDLNGAAFVTIDGRPGGAGTAQHLTVANTSTVGVAMRFINDARNNTVRYVTLQGVNTNADSGTMVFGTSAGGNGNDSNTIDRCDIRDGASTPANAIYALGTTTTATQNNSANTVSNCNIYNFYSASAVDSAGIRLEAGNTNWTITGNSFYQTATRTAVAAVVRGIFVNSGGTNFIVISNVIGGTAANAGGPAWTTSGTTLAYAFVGIELNVGTSPVTSVQGNTVRNIVWTSFSNLPSPDGLWCGIYVQAGAANVGTATANTIGSGTGTGSVSVTTAGGGTTGRIFGIASSSSGTVVISNNNVGSITTNGANTNTSLSLTAIQVTAGTNTISANTIGSTTTANSLNAVTLSTGGNPDVIGVYASGTISASITTNLIANLNNNYSGAVAGAQVIGIETVAGVNTITGNTVRNLSTRIPQNPGTSSASVIGISQRSTTSGQTVSQNLVHSLSNTEPTAPVSLTGIYYAGGSGGTNVISRNVVHSLTLVSSDNASSIVGMDFGNGAFIAHNNLVRVGLDANGASTAGASRVIGIWDDSGQNGRNFFYNSVYLGGTQTSGTGGTFAFSSNGSVNTRVFRNNIYFNARSNSGATGSNYAVEYAGTNSSPAGLTASNNIFYTSGAGGVLGFHNGPQSTLAAWQAATGVDAGSINADPVFANPNGNATSFDLHLKGPTPANNAGTPIGTVTIDFDGQARSATTPDIGADELSINANLSSLFPSAGTLTPAFSSGTTSYTSTVSNATASITFTPSVADSNSTVTVNGVIVASGNPSGTLNLSYGTNNISVVVTAQDGTTTKTYSIVVTRQATVNNWRQTYYGTTVNSGNAADTADPYNKGIQNLAVFAFFGANQDPQTASINLLPQVQMSGGNLFYTFTQPASVTGVTYGAEWRADLSSGIWTQVADTGSGTTHTFSVPIAGNPQIFMRLRVSTP